MSLLELNQTLQYVIDQQQWQNITPILQQAYVVQQENPDDVALLSLGQRLRNAQQWQLSLDFFQTAGALVAESWQAYIDGWSAEIAAQLEDYPLAAQYAVKAFNKRDTDMMAQRPKRHLVSFSLYGSSSFYCEATMINAQMMPEIYPDADMRVYHDDSVPAQVLCRLKDLGVQLVNVAEIDAADMPGTFWRFLALEDFRYDAVMMRDADSIIGEREKVLVSHWLASEKPFHVIRDDYGHGNLILAGLWGARNGLLGGIRGWIRQYLAQTPDLHRTHADQLFLEHHIWHRIKHQCLHHSVFPADGSCWPSELPLVNLVDGKPQQLGSWRVWKFPDQLPWARYTFSIHEGDKLICCYQADNIDYFELPTSYMEKIASQQWQLSFKPL